MAKNLPRPRLAEAGPGGGKTHTMVDQIAAAIQTLPPNRFLAAVTYTNAAANTIRERLSQRVPIKPNVFVGTTHAFMNRFILAPYAELFSLLPADRIYVGINVHDKGRGAANYRRNLIGKGIVPYDAMVPLARQVLQDSTARKRICMRLAHIFIDEFQDADIAIYEVFEHFRKGGKTCLFAVGDPEQYVTSFTYRGQRPPKFDQIPFFRFKKTAQTGPIIENHRSNEEIVTFANQFRHDLQQKAMKPRRNEPRVLFLPARSLPELIPRFQALSRDVETSGPHRTRLYLSEDNATFDSVCETFHLTPISNLGRRSRSVLGDTLELLSMSLDRSQRAILSEFELSRLEWRSYGIALLCQLRTGGFALKDLRGFVESNFRHKVSKGRFSLLEEELKLLRARLCTTGPTNKQELVASIRKAKGLQADAVLVVAKRRSELKKWLCTDRSARANDRQDKCRLGYVAFTRAREMLCIGCLEPIDDESAQLFDRLGITVAMANTEQLPVGE